jgi:hypothetical protein
VEWVGRARGGGRVTGHIMGRVCPLFIPRIDFSAEFQPRPGHEEKEQPGGRVIPPPRAGEFNMQALVSQLLLMQFRFRSV